VLSEPKKILKKYFGYENFRPMQQDIVEAALHGQDVLVLMPTGGGKSICYQVPALCLPGITIVVSPLIALMQDQVEALKRNGIAAAFLNSSQDWQEQSVIERQCMNGQLKLLYVSPEKLLSESFQYLIRQMKVSLFAIDEAHCISFWGHDFRLEYTQLGKIKKDFPSVPLMALTATADKLTRQDIMRQLGLQQSPVFVSSFDRPNLSLAVHPAQDRIKRILEFLEDHPFEAGIIYCLSRKACEQVAAKLERAGYKAAFYHAAMPHEQRMKTQDAFLKDDIQIVCATVAFGMGIDKSNVRWVIHHNLPKNIESYYQEIGRAGRDGLPADTLLFYSFADVMKQRGMLEELPDQRRSLQEAKLERLQQYAEAHICRRKILLAYFGELQEENCENCDVCRHPHQSFDGTVLAQKALSAVARSQETLPLSLLIDVLRGADTEEVRRKGLFKIKTYGSGRDLHPLDWRNYLQQLINTGMVEVAYDEHQRLKLNQSSRDVLFDGKKVALYKAELPAASSAPRPKPKIEQLGGPLFDRLRKLRKSLADEQGVPPYVIFSDKTLQEMAADRPVTEESMLQVNGVGRVKMENYGHDFITEIMAFNKEQRGSQEKEKGATHLLTLELLQEGRSPEQIAEQRGMHPTTIYSHVASLYEQGHLKSLSAYVNEQELQAIGDALYVHGIDSQLKFLFDSLKGRFPYHKIRLAIAHYKKSGMKV
jgi:ATP-dependent DNA helicase RecQ